MKQAWNILWLLVTNENIGRWKNEARRQTVLIFLSFLPCFTCQVVTFLLLTELRFRKGLDKLKLAILYHCKSDLLLLYYYIIIQSQIVQSWVKITQDWCEIDFRSESFERNKSIIFLSTVLWMDFLKRIEKSIPNRLLNKEIKETCIKI